ncbi:MAG: GTPase ObgE [Planctomycetes bacterium]|nr:GTPase ObgE [Planctomycetota bacterium]
MFLDEAVIHVRSGDGGNGCVSFRREKFVPKGGPDGGDGGHGGSVFLRGDESLSTLLDVGRRKSYRSESGRPGMGNNRSGRRGRDLIVGVPVGTTVREIVTGAPPREGRLLGDIVEHGMKLVVARGGRGGKGNKAFASSVRRVPRFAQKGEPGESRQLYLELRLLADVGLVGLPNSGKSTLLSKVSAATPKIADYPFTTLQPNLGIAEIGEYSRLVIADIPGLIEGAHQGQGLGIEFLRHIERTKVLVHLLSAEAKDAGELESQYRVVESELASYSSALAGKPRILALSKIDILTPEAALESAAEIEGRLGLRVLRISAATGEGLSALLGEADRLVRASDAEAAAGSGR